MNLDGFYINLDRSEDRRASMTSQIDALGCGHFIRRFPAIDGGLHGPLDNPATNGVWACRRSHEEVIFQSDEQSLTLVLEDDVDLSRSFPGYINETVLSGLAVQAPDLDILFLDCFPAHDQMPRLLAIAEHRMPHRATADAPNGDRHAVAYVDFIAARGVYCFCAAAYLVTPKGKATLRRLLPSCEPHVPIDMLYRHWIQSGEMNASIAVPFLVTAKYMSPSTISYDLGDQSGLPSVIDGHLGSAVRRLLFAGDSDLDMDTSIRFFAVTPPSDEFVLGMQLAGALQRK